MVQLSPVATSPRTTLLLATDFSHANRAAFDPVMYVGIDSLGLVAAVERQQVRQWVNTEITLVSVKSAFVSVISFPPH
jgi:hypothetical protein